jgi:hypothetical protein
LHQLDAAPGPFLAQLVSSTRQVSSSNSSSNSFFMSESGSGSEAASSAVSRMRLTSGVYG